MLQLQSLTNCHVVLNLPYLGILRQVPSLYYVSVNFKYARECLSFSFSVGLDVTEGQSLLASFKKDTIFCNSNYCRQGITKDYYLLGCDACSLIDRYQNFWAICFLHPQVTLKMASHLRRLLWEPQISQGICVQNSLMWCVGFLNIFPGPCNMSSQGKQDKIDLNLKQMSVMVHLKNFCHCHLNLMHFDTFRQIKLNYLFTLYFMVLVPAYYLIFIYVLYRSLFHCWLLFLQCTQNIGMEMYRC